jgi:diguanylate cyclase (GGDEF)-like protein
MPPTRPEIPRSPALASQFIQSLRFGTVVLGALVLSSALLFAIEFLVLGPHANRYREAARAVRLAHLGMLNQETGVRGFLLSRDPAFLAPYNAGVDSMAENNVILAHQLAGDHRFGDAHLAFRLAQQVWRSQWADPIVSESDKPADIAEGKVLFTLYRHAEEQLETGLDARFVIIAGQRRNLFIAVGILQLALFGLAVFGGRSRLRALEAATLPAVTTVLSAVRRVRDGRLEPLERRPASAEFEDIQEGLDQMIQALAQGRTRADSQAQTTARLTADLRQLLVTAREFSGTLNLRYVLRALVKSASGITRQPFVTVWLLDEAARRLDPYIDTQGPQGQPTGLEPIEIGAGMVGRAARYGRTMVPGSSRPMSESDTPTDAPDEIAVPLIVGARVVGVLQIAGPDGDRSPDALEMLEILASHAASAIESARLHQTSEEHSQRDALTKLYNRRRLNADLDEEVRRCRRYRRPLSFIMFDVDHFKKLNDTHGHARGDQVLQELGRVLEETVRETDTAYRYGGEEFCIVVRETPLEGARDLAERLRQRVQTHFGRGDPAVTASFGVASFSEGMATSAELVASADRSLYDAKHAGRNRVSISQPAPALPS